MHAFKPGGLFSRLLGSARLVETSASTTSWFWVSFLNGVGMRTGIVIDLSCLKGVLYEGFKFLQIWPYKLGLADFVDNSLLSFEAVSGDTENYAFISWYASTLDQF